MRKLQHQTPLQTHKSIQMCREIIKTTLQSAKFTISATKQCITAQNCGEERPISTNTKLHTAKHIQITTAIGKQE